MTDLANIRDFTIPRPGPNFIGSAADFDALPETHREQILFLDKAAEAYIFQFAAAARLVTGGFWDPFAKGNFRTVETYDRFYGTQETKGELKKWLFRRGIPFATWVFVLSAVHEPMLMTWKMMVKYVEHIFFGDDVMVFDPTLRWCLVYYHHDQLFFGKDPVFDPAEDEQRMKELNDRKRKYPRFRHPYL